MLRCQTRPIANVAAEVGISRQCASKWVNRHRRFGELGLADRSSTPPHQPKGHISRSDPPDREDARGQEVVGSKGTVPSQEPNRLAQRWFAGVGQKPCRAQRFDAAPVRCVQADGAAECASTGYEVRHRRTRQAESAARITAVMRACRWRTYDETGRSSRARYIR